MVPSRLAISVLVLFAHLACSAHSSAQDRTGPRPAEIPSIDAEIQLVWGQFVDRLKAGDAEGASQLLSPEVRARYEQSFRDLGEHLRELPGGWSKPVVVSVSLPFAEYFVSQTFKGEERGHLVYFVRHPKGQWFIESF
jgi:hypothetical protein